MGNHEPVKVIPRSGYELQAKFSKCFAEYGLFLANKLERDKKKL